MVILETILAFIILVGILVFVHEMGHFLAARWCGVRTDVFAIGMGPRLFGWNRKTGFSLGKLPEDLDLEGGTDYRLSAFPIGGYVKIVGMVDESMDTTFVAHKPEPWEFRSKNTLQKAFIISAGVIMNFLLAIVVFTALNFTEGKTMAATTTVGLLPESNPAAAAGLHEGDKITAVNGDPVRYFQDITRAIYIDHASEDVTLSVERDGMPMTVTFPRTSIPDQSSAQPVIPYSEHHYVVVSAILEKSPAEKAGLKVNDMIREVNGVRVASAEDLTAQIAQRMEDKEPVTLTVIRDGHSRFVPVEPDENAKIGTGITAYHGSIAQIDYSFTEAISGGFNETLTITGGTFDLVKKLVMGEANLKKSVGGPLKIASIAQETASRGLSEFLRLMGILSVTLACMNILPIPALDGGHLVFIIVEGVIRREVPLKIRMAIQQVGFALLLIFMIFVLYNDLDTTKFFGN